MKTTDSQTRAGGGNLAMNLSAVKNIFSEPDKENIYIFGQSKFSIMIIKTKPFPQYKDLEG